MNASECKIATCIYNKQYWYIDAVKCNETGRKNNCNKNGKPKME